MEQLQDTQVMTPETRIVTAYISYMLNNGHAPASVYKFAQDLGISEEEFYNHFGSFTSIERKIWLDFIDNTISRIENDAAYLTFDSRDKILTFYYAFFQELKKSRSFVLLQLGQHKKHLATPNFLKDFKARYTSFIEGVINAGKTNGDIAKRPFFDKRYPSVFWLHMTFLLLFWRDDSSQGFEKTDAAIEKSVSLAFELIGKGAVDSVVDFAKFLYQTRVK
ncbi:MAG: TetR/AcrR family transcriptional regulator [Chitinophagaceae bacterium]|nr:TetR/AcrR family transcriptional regulator [Chitinophagaceae bacterium]